MSDYVSRDAALNCFHDWIDQHGDVHTADEMTEYNAIADLPAADVRENRHGRWIIDTAFGNDVMSNNEMALCSECGKGTFHRSTANFCENCGADMRSE